MVSVVLMMTVMALRVVHDLGEGGNTLGQDPSSKNMLVLAWLGQREGTTAYRGHVSRCEQSEPGSPTTSSSLTWGGGGAAA